MSFQRKNYLFPRMFLNTCNYSHLTLHRHKTESNIFGHFCCMVFQNLAVHHIDISRGEALGLVGLLSYMALLESFPEPFFHEFV